ncbi:hypothetical protein JAAARDRAFT_190139 [Jaapia argillacea MUCL 33604]|uniref:Protein kinase domain-containing protein n=1 Tax=Jaapia argillacea MUCL 33604 TaxID=933084 RepID=A0A067Q2Z0_9AGAM|nr:hypothetical protein JAAARDRAFT_190139 [Jaapia argillacea MUCL 33604]
MPINPRYFVDVDGTLEPGGQWSNVLAPTYQSYGVSPRNSPDMEQPSGFPEASVTAEDNGGSSLDPSHTPFVPFSQPPALGHGEVSSRGVDRSIDLSDLVVIVRGPLRGGSTCELYAGELSRNEERKEKVAMKQLRVFLNWSDEQRDLATTLFHREVKIWSRFDHPHILPFYGYAVIDEARYFLISPWAVNGNIMEYLERFPATDRSVLILQIADALVYLHNRDECAYIHGDLKGDNILISEEGKALVCDFGLTRRVELVASMTATPSGVSGLGHIRFSAPELFQSARPTRESDVFAFGCLAIQIFTGQQPYNHLTTDLQVLRAVSDGDIPLRPIDLTDTWWDLIASCLEWYPSLRPSMAEIVDILMNDRLDVIDTIMPTTMHSTSISSYEFDPDGNINFYGTPPPQEPPPLSPRSAWRAVRPRRNRRAAAPPPPLDTRPWTSWRPDPNFMPTPSPTGGVSLLVPARTSPGPWAPRSPHEPPDTLPWMTWHPDPNYMPSPPPRDSDLLPFIPITSPSLD